jgi:hypothetical protein
VTQRGDDVVSGRMMPTFAPLPSTVPPVLELLAPVDAGGVDPVAGVVAAGGVVAGVLEFPPLVPLELQAASASAAATPTAATGQVLLRMQSRLSVVGRRAAWRENSARRMLCARTYPMFRRSSTTRHQLVT